MAKAGRPAGTGMRDRTKVSTYVSGELAMQLKSLADRNERTVSVQARLLLRDALAASAAENRT